MVSWDGCEAGGTGADGRSGCASELLVRPRATLCGRSCVLREAVESFQVACRRWCPSRCLLFGCIVHLPFAGVEAGLFGGLAARAPCEQVRSW